jgi:hypothetical protein
MDLGPVFQMPVNREGAGRGQSGPSCVLVNKSLEQDAAKEVILCSCMSSPERVEKELPEIVR